MSTEIQAEIRIRCAEIAAKYAVSCGEAGFQELMNFTSMLSDLVLKGVIGVPAKASTEKS